VPLGLGDLPVVVGVDASSTRGQRNWSVGSPDKRKGAQWTETPTDRVDSDRGDAMSRQERESNQARCC